MKLEKLDVAIIGGGLSGLACAYLLNGAGLNVKLYEAAARLGGRIQSIRDDVDNRVLADLGPSWVWPEYQPILAYWLDELGIETFPQFDTGLGIIDRLAGQKPQRHPIPGQYGIARLLGGPSAFIDALLHQIPKHVLELGAPVVAITEQTGALKISISGANPENILADNIILATPLRIAASKILWPYSIDAKFLRALGDTPTWMASQAKFACVYEKPFWRENGLSGRIASQAGPLFEVHDNSENDAKTGSLFGFVGWGIGQRNAHSDELKNQIFEQLGRCFGSQALKPSQFQLEDWAENPWICSQNDRDEPPRHPEIADEVLRIPQLNQRLFVAVAEAATQSPGLIEGALQAAMAASSAIKQKLKI